MSHSKLAKGCLLAIFLIGFHSAVSAQAKAQTPRTFRVWVFADAHVGSDKRHSRDSLATAIRQSEAPSGFAWDIALDLGDMSGEQATPKDPEGAEVVQQFAALNRHRREQVYDLSGNHDRSGLDEPLAWWWRKWVDPTGEHTEFSHVDARKRPFPIEGTWERYSFRVGNLLFLMMSDINEPTQKVGRGTLGGNPGGVVSGETFAWWKRMVEQNGSSIIISAHHYVLKDTTVASGEWEGMQRAENGSWKTHYHGYFPQGTPQGASFLYWVDSKPDSGAFESFLEAAPKRVDLWLGAHTHTNPDDTYGGKSHIERRWGTTFINVAGLTRYHTAPENSIPRSWLLTFTEGSDDVRARCYLHGDEYAPQGWYDKVERVIKLSRPFKMPPKIGATATDADLSQAERTFEQATSNRQTETLARLLHQDFFWIDTDGAQQTASQFLRRIKESTDIGADSNVKTRSYGATAIAFGETRDGPYAQPFTRIWVRTSAGWRLFAYQKTSITPSPTSSQPQERRPDSPSTDEANFIVNTTARTRAEREVVDAVRAINRAEHSPDWSAWAALTVDEFQVINVRGHVDLKADRVNTIRQQAQSTPFPKVRDLRIRVFGNTAVMTAIQEPALASPFRFTRLWVKTNGGWKQVINHQTPTITLSARQVAAQTDPRSPTDPSDPLKLLVDKLNDPQRGATLRAQWNIDRAVWNEPVTAVRNGVTVLVTPAYADIHTSIDSAGAKWSPDGPLISAPHNPTGARVFIPRGYQNQTAPRRMVPFAPGGDSTEYTFEPAYGVRSPVLRRGYVLCVTNAWSSVATPIPLAQWGPRLNEIVAFAQKMLSSGFGLPAPTYTYAWGESRGARMLAYSSELAGTPFDGVIENRGGGDLVESALEQVQMLRELRAVNSADDQVLADYISKIGRRMKITARNGGSHEEFIPISPGDDERFFFQLPPLPNILMPVIPPYIDNPVTASDSRFRVPAGGGNRSGGDNPFDGTLAWSAGPISTRRFLNEVDSEYAAEVDNGIALLRDWNPDTRPAEVRAAIARLTRSGQIKTKVLKVHGTLDPNIYPLTAIKYVQKIVDQNLSNQLRWYLVPGMGHVRSTLEETFVDANGKRISLGVQLTHLDLLINWVEKGIDPGDFVSVDPTDPTKTLAVRGAHQLGLQKSPLQYFWTVSGIQRYAASEAAVAQSRPIRREIIRAGPATIQVKVNGDGEPIVFIPSRGRGVEDFDALSDRLVGAGYQAILPEPRGIGGSTGPLKDITYHDLASDIAATLDSLARGPAIVVGHDFGGRIARTLASDDPKLVKQLILLSAGGMVPRSPEVEKLTTRFWETSLTRRDRLNAIREIFFAAGNDPRVWEQGWYFEVARAQRASDARTPLNEWSAGGSAPMLVIQGMEDVVAVPENAKKLAAEFPSRVTLVEIPQAGHALLPEQSEEVAKAVLAYLRSTRGTR